MAAQKEVYLRILNIGRYIHLFSSAVLLHFEEKDFINFINEIKFKGIFFFSLKEGVGNEYDKEGRYFTYYKKEKVEKILKNNFELLSFQRNEDFLGRNFHWISFIVKLK